MPSGALIERKDIPDRIVAMKYCALNSLLRNFFHE